VKEFVLDYARYRRLGFDMVESIDLALSRRSAAAHSAGVVAAHRLLVPAERLVHAYEASAQAEREVRAQAARAQLRLVKCSSPVALAGNATAPVSREWGAPHVTAAGIDVANKAFSPGFLPGPRPTGDATPQPRKVGDL
jgi:hypothetical protein